MSPIRLVILGAGHLGRIHTKLAHSLAEFKILGVVDPIDSNRQYIAEQFHLPTFASLEDITSSYDAALIVTPTKFHYELALRLLKRRIHLFIEKPITTTATDAAHLVELAEANQCVVQVGHVERFNPAFLAAKTGVSQPKSFASVRNGIYTFRSTDVSVVLDLMIHDLDLALSLFNSDPVAVQATGGKVFGPNDDYAEARVEFASGGVAQFSASRASHAAQRTCQIITENNFTNIDFQTKKVTRVAYDWQNLVSVTGNSMTANQAELLKSQMGKTICVPTELPVTENNAILEEQKEFAAAIRGTCRVTADGHAGCLAVDLAEKIMAQIAFNSSRLPKTGWRNAA